MQDEPPQEAEPDLAEGQPDEEAEIPAPADLPNRNIERPTTSYKHSHPSAGQ